MVSTRAVWTETRLTHPILILLSTLKLSLKKWYEWHGVLDYHTGGEFSDR